MAEKKSAAPLGDAFVPLPTMPEESETVPPAPALPADEAGDDILQVDSALSRLPIAAIVAALVNNGCAGEVLRQLQQKPELCEECEPPPPPPPVEEEEDVEEDAEDVDDKLHALQLQHEQELRRLDRQLMAANQQNESMVLEQNKKEAVILALESKLAHFQREAVEAIRARKEQHQKGVQELVLLQQREKKLEMQQLLTQQKLQREASTSVLSAAEIISASKRLPAGLGLDFRRMHEFVYLQYQHDQEML